MSFKTRPSRRHVWVGGHWNWSNGVWDWRSGYWVDPPAQRVHWIRPKYIKVRGGWKYIPGHWSNERVIVVR